MILLDGKLVSQQMLNKLKTKIEDDKLKINLDIIILGNDPASIKYVSMKNKRASEIGIGGAIHHLAIDSNESAVLNLIEKLNHDPTVTGFMVQLPLPAKFNKKKILSAIDPKKDVDGLNPKSLVSPATVRGILTLLDFYHIDLDNKEIVIVNDSDLIGKPLKRELEKNGQKVILLNDQVKDISPYTLGADILISATGVQNLITANMVKTGAVVVDVAGDVDFDHVKGKCSYITPPIGGVGPMTVASLLENTYSILKSHGNI